jgi:hypothetical protein
VAGTSKFGVVEEIYSDSSKVKWEGSKPFYITIKMDEDGRVFVAHPSQINKVKKRS